MVNFIPDNTPETEVVVPWFEDSQKEGIEGYATTKTPEALQSEIRGLMVRLNAYNVRFTSGVLDAKPKRYGYQIHFQLNGMPGRIDCAALPIKSETPARKQVAQAQALYFVRDWLAVEVRSTMFRPGAMTLLPYLIGENGKTVTEALIETYALPIPMLMKSVE